MKHVFVVLLAGNAAFTYCAFSFICVLVGLAFGLRGWS